MLITRISLSEGERERLVVYGPNGVEVGVGAWPGEEKFEVPEGWKEELRRRRIVVVSPRTVGNSMAVAWRLTGAVVAARRAMQELEVDEGRL